MKLYTADAIKKQVHKLLCQDCGETDYCPKCDYRELIDQILDAPTVDAIPVVRCKDCKYAWMTYDGECKYCDMWEEEGEMYLDGDFYCAFGERKEDGERMDSER